MNVIEGDGKFSDGQPSAGLGRSSDKVQEIIVHDGSPVIQIGLTEFLFTAEFTREGSDLILTGEAGQIIRIEGYFSDETPADLRSPEGAVLRGNVVAKLAGPETPGAYAQEGNPAGGEPIGQVEKLEGEATVQRADGTVETLRIGTKVFQNDVVQTADGGSLSLTFVDGTIFTLASGSRMLLDELIYDPNSNSNSAAFNLIEGSFVFIAGQVAKTGGMDVVTPVATMGIRGTTVKVDIETVNGLTTVEVTLNRDPDGGIGRFTITNLDGEVIGNVTTDQTKWLLSPEGLGREVERSDIDLAQDQAVITKAVNAYNQAQDRAQQGEGFVPGADNNAPPHDEGSGPSPDDNGEQPPEENGQPGEENGERQGNLLDPDGRPAIETTLVEDLFDALLDELEKGKINDPHLGQSVGIAELVNEVIDEIEDQPLTEEQELELQAIEEVASDSGTTQTTDTNPTITLPTLNSEVDEDGQIVLSGFEISDPDGDILLAELEAHSTVTIVPGSGVTIIEGDGVDDERLVIQGTAEQLSAALNGLTYYPSPNADGDGGLTISITDGSFIVSDTLVIGISPVQDDPTAANDTNGRREDANIYFGNVLANDTDPDTGDSLSIQSVQAVIGGESIDIALGTTVTLDSGGRFSINANGQYSFDPFGAYNGLAEGENSVEVITYTLTDGNGGTSQATLTLTITGENDPPTAVADSGGMTIGDEFNPSGNLLTNDSDPDTSDTITVTSASEGATPITLGTPFTTSGGGQLTISANGNYIFDPGSAYDALADGVDVVETFAYTISDGNGGTSQSTLTITITGSNTNSAPVAVADNVPGVLSSEFQVNTVEQNVQANVSVAQLTGGQVVITWRSDEAVGSDVDGAIKAKILDSNGNVLVNEFLVNTLTSGFQNYPEVAALSNGNFVIIWDSDTPGQGDSSLSGVKSRVFDPAGAEVFGEDLANYIYSFGEQIIPDAVGLSNGNYFGVWQSETGNSDSSGFGIMGAIFSDPGTKVVNEFQINAITSGNQTSVRTDLLANGNIIVSWTDESAADIKFRIFDQTGNPITNELQANSNSNGTQNYSDILALDGGGFIVAWQSDDSATGDGSGYSIQARIFDSGGVETVSEFTVNDLAVGNQHEPRLTQLENGNIAVTWYSDTPGQGDNSLAGIKAKVLDSSGNTIVSEFLVNEFTNQNQYNPQIESLADGGFIVSWYSYDQQQSDFDLTAIKARIFNADGTARDHGAVFENSAFAIDAADLLANDTDADPYDTLSITGVDASSTSGAVVSLLGTTISYDPTGVAAFNQLAVGQTATDTFNYTISDGHAGGTSTGTVTVTVTGTDDAPVISVIDFNSVNEGNTGVLSNVSFDLNTILTASDVDNGETPSIDTGSIVINEAPSSDFNGFANFAVSGTVLTMDTAKFDNLAEGEFAIYNVSFDVVSGASRTTHTTQITFDGVNDAPTLDSPLPDFVIDEDASSSGVVGTNFSDRDNGATLTFSAQKIVGGSPQALPTFITFVAATATFVLTSPADADVGAHLIEVTATDEFGGSVSSQLTITVNNINDVPTVDMGILDQNAVVNTAFSYTIPSDAFADNDIGDTLTYEAFVGVAEDPIPSWLNFSGSTFSGNPANTDFNNGSATITVRATDGAGAQVTTTFQMNLAADVVGTSLADSLSGDGLDNYVQALDGNDTIDGSAGDDILDGGIGTDTVDYGFASNPVTVDLAAGTATGTDIGSDTLISIEGIIGGIGDDILTGDGGTNTINGNLGNDTINGAGGNDFLFGTAGDDILIGGAGADVLNAGDNFDILEGGAGNDTLIGGSRGYSNGDDFDVATYENATNGITATLTGALNTNSSQVIGGASSGVDTLTNIDMIRGTQFDDVFKVDATFEGQYGDFNAFQGLGGDDQVFGNGSTRVDYQGATGGVLVDLDWGRAFSIGTNDAAGIGNDYYIVDFTNTNLNIGDKVVKWVIGSDHNDILRGSDADREDFRGMAGDDFISGKGGTRDRADYRDDPAAVTVDLGAGTATDGWGGHDTLVDIERARGSAFNDTLIGDSGNNALFGHLGNDQLNGAGGWDYYVGGGGDDTFNGSTGTGDTDLAAYWDATAGVTITLSGGLGSTSSTATGNVDTGTDTLINMEGAYGSDYNDTYAVAATYAGSGGNTITTFEGGKGDDTIEGNGAVKVTYWDAADAITVNLQTGTAFSTNVGDTAQIGTDIFITNGSAARSIGHVVGSDFDDLITGSNDGLAEILEGQNGKDVIDGGTDNVATVAYDGGSIFADMSVGPSAGSFYVYDGYGTRDVVSHVNAISGSQNDDTLTAWDDYGVTLMGNGGNDTITGGIFGDVLSGGSGNDTIFGGAGDDYITPGVSDSNGNQLRGSIGNDTYDFADSDSNTWNSLDYDGSVTQALTFNVDFNANSGTVLKGSDGTDTFVNFANQTYGMYLGGKSQNDIFNITTGANDFVILHGDNGVDTFNVDSSLGGGVRLNYKDFGNTGNGIVADLSPLDSAQNATIIDSYLNTDIITAGSDIWEIQGSHNADDISGSNADESFILRASNNGSGVDQLDGGGGFDRLRYDRSGVDALNIDLTQLGAEINGTWDGFGFSHDIQNIEWFVGSSNDDIMTADNSGVRFDGKEGGDTITGGDGNDTINPGSNTGWYDGTADSIFASAGVDTYSFSEGDENSFIGISHFGLTGLSGGITFNLTDDTASVSKQFGAGVQTDTYSNFDKVSGVHIEGTTFDDVFNIDGQSGAGWTVNSGLSQQWIQLQGNAGSDTFNLIDGFLLLTYDAASSGINVDLTNIATTNVSYSDGFGAVDTILAGSTVSELRGTNFADSFIGSAADDRFVTREGNDTVDGAGGFDLVRYDRNGVTGVNVDLSNVTGLNASGTWNGNPFTDSLFDIEWVRGSNSADTLTGSSADEKLEGKGGSDVLDGGGGNDELITGTAEGGTDTIIGNTGNDTIDVSELTDGHLFLDYSSGVFVNGLTVNLGNNTGIIDGGVGIGTDTISGLRNIDGINYGSSFVGTSYADSFTIDFEADEEWMQIRGGAGDDFFQVLGGTIRLDYSTDPGAINANLATGTIVDGYGDTDTVEGIVWEIKGTNGNDVFVGSAADEAFVGMGGNDSYDGGEGFDRIRYDSGTEITNLTVDLAAGTATGTATGIGSFTDALVSIERVRGSNNADNLFGSIATERLEGKGGNDLIIGGGGRDQLEGGSGNDTIRVTDDGFKLVDGGTGLDRLELLGAGQVLDFTNLPDNYITGIEAGSLGIGDAGNTLNIDSDAVILASDEANTDIAAILGNGDDALLIDGDAADTINLSSSASNGSWVLDAGDSTTYVGYDVYHYSEGAGTLARLVIDEDISNVNLV